MSGTGSTPPDFSAAARKPLERLSIVEYVLNMPGLQETDYLEWKTGYDLSGRPGAAATAKHLIGFANRDFPQAARHAEGHAYLLLGVEPTNLVGVDEWDSADVQRWLERFAGHDIRYDLHYVETGGKKVMFLTIDPPRQGDPVFCMQAASSEPGGKALPEGTIYVRRNGLTDVASAADVKRLSERAAGAPAELDLQLALDGSNLVPIAADALDKDAKRRWLNREEHRLLSSLPPERTGGTPFMTRSISSAIERRTPDQFQLEVAAYTSRADSAWFGIAASEHMDGVGSTFDATVVNNSADNYEDVVVELILPVSKSWVYVRPEDARRFKPRPPAPFNSLEHLQPNLDLLTPGALSIGAQPVIEMRDEMHTLVRFPALHVRPHTPHQLDELSLFLPPQFAGKTIDVEWRITARNRSGQVSGTTGLTVPGEPEAS